MLREVRTSARTAFCVLAISIYSGAYVEIPAGLQKLDYVGGATNPVNAIAMAVLLAAGLFLAALNWRRFLFVLKHGGVVNIFIILCFISIIWSSYPLVTFRRSIVLLQMTMFGYYLVSMFSMRRILQLWTYALGIALAASLVVAIAVPDVGVSSEGELAGTWRGVFSQKNALGAVSVLAALAAGWLWANERTRRRLYAFVFLLAIGMAVLAQSKTSQLTLLFMFSIIICLPMCRLPGLARIWGFFLVFLVALFDCIVGYLYYADILTALGKDPSLTGRLPVWATTLDLASNYPFGGYGYSGFFIVGNPDIDYLWGRTGWSMWEAHNAYIDLLVQLGIPGLMLALWALGEGIYRSLRAWTDGGLSWSRLAAAYMIGFAVTNVTESMLFRSGNINCVLFPLLFVALRIEAARNTAQAAANAIRLGRPIDPLYERWH